MTRFEKSACLMMSVCYGSVALHFAASGGAFPDPPALYSWILAVGAVMGLAVIDPISARVAGKVTGVLAWARNLAYLSLAITVMEGLADVTPWSPYRDGDFLFHFDPYLWVITGGLGLWLLAVNIAALRGSTWSRSLSRVGCFAGACCVAFPIAVFAGAHGYVDFILQLPLAVGLGTLLPVWFVWVAASSPSPEA